MFAGIGGFREGLTRAGGFTCVGHCGCDKYAERSYRALFDTEREWYTEDARKADPDTMPGFDLLCGGFPCQSFSSAGKRRGFGDPRGTLFFELARLAEAGTLAICCLRTWPTCFTMTKAGRLQRSSIRWTDWGTMSNGRCLTAKILASPQSRRRVYIIGSLDGRCAGKVFPFTETTATPAADGWERASRKGGNENRLQAGLPRG